jgi:hypothetical protein
MRQLSKWWKLASLQSREDEDWCTELGLETQKEKQGMGLLYKILSEQGPSEIFTLASGTVRTRQATGTKSL